MTETSPEAILLVGPEPAPVEGLEELAAGLGRPLVRESDGGEALRACVRGAAPAAVVAWDGPGVRVTALDLLNGLVAAFGEGRPPTIVLARPDDESLLAEALEAGAADAVLLPCRPGDLLARLQARLRLGPRGAPTTRRFTRDTAFAGPPSRLMTQGGGFRFAERLLLREIGHGGGITRVLKALRLEDGSLAAIKLLDPDVAAQDEDWSRRFAREQQVLAGIEHPNLVKVRSGGTLDGVPYLDMDYFPGETLDARIEREGRVEPAEAVAITAAVARGLGALHERGIVHRDVKPENVLIDTRGHVRVCDFGLSKPHDDAGLTHEGEILGTAAFIAPELLTGGAPSARSDVYALGVTLFEMLTGEDAIEPGPTQSMFQDSMRGAAQTRALRMVTNGVRPVVSRMLAVNPADRYRSVDALLGDLEPLAAAG